MSISNVSEEYTDQPRVFTLVERTRPLDIDPSSLEAKSFTPDRLITPALQLEIAEVQSRGYCVEIGSGTPDRAYENPEKVLEMYQDLDRRGQEFTNLRRNHVRAPVAGTFRRGATKQWRKNRESALEDYRLNHFFNESKGRPWHDQRGCATALLTITGAHDLLLPGEAADGYRTQSAILDKTVLTHQFGRGNSLTGLSIRDAIINVGGRFYDKDPEQAAIFADRQLGKLEAFLDAPVNERFRDIVRYCTDSLGIRSRKEEVRMEISRHIDDKIQREPGLKIVTMMSVGCGTALPMLEVASDMKAKGLAPTLILLDQDPVALASALQIAKKMNLEDCVEIHCERLFSRFGKPIDMQNLLQGRDLDVCEDSGLREYLPNRIYTALTKEIWNALADDGIMTTGNMNKNRIQGDFLHGLMGWAPQVQQRTIQEGLSLHHRAGVPREAMRMRVTQDGIYTLYFSSKAELNALRAKRKNAFSLATRAGLRTVK